MFKAAFFAANQQPVEENQDKAEGQSLTLDVKPAKSFKTAAAKFAEQFGFKLTDEGRPENAFRFSRIQSFGVEGHTLRLFVWSAS